MDLLKAFHCFLHDILIAKLHKYGLLKDAVTFVYSYLKSRKQGRKIIDIQSFIQILLSTVMQNSVLGPILFNLFINDLFLFTKDLLKKYINEVIKLLGKERKLFIDWFKTII